MKLIIAIILLTATVFSAKAQQAGKLQKAELVLKNRGEAVVKFRNPGIPVMKELQQSLSIDRIFGDSVVAYVNEKGFKKFVRSGIGFEVVSPVLPEKRLNVVEKVLIDTIKAWDFYPSYDAYIDIMQQFQANFPAICEVFTIGQSVEEREIMVARIGALPLDVPSDKPSFLYTSTMHGDETLGFILMLNLIDYLLENFDSDPEVTQILNNIDIWINPLANPDGLYAGGNNTVYQATRFNANYVDLNRNFPDPEDGDHPDGNDWQPETVAFMELAEEHLFTMSANIHSGAEVINYPWDTWSRLHADDEWYKFVSREYADTAQASSPAGYLTDLNNGITNGYDWYTTSGNRQDFMNYFHNCREVTMELSDTKILPESQLDDYWSYNRRPLLNYMKQSAFGLRGKVLDSLSGNPLKAMVFIEGHDEDNSWVYTDSLTGNYFRPIFEGNYNVSFISPGYTTKTLENITVNNYEQLVQDVLLTESQPGINQLDISSLRLYPNPTSEEVRLSLHTRKAINLEIFIAYSNGVSIPLNEQTLMPGKTDLSISLKDYKPGSYYLIFRTGQDFFSKPLIIRHK